MAGMDFFIRPATGTGSADWIRIPNADIDVKIARRLTRTIIRGGEGDNLHDEGAESTIYTVRGILSVDDYKKILKMFRTGQPSFTIRLKNAMSRSFLHPSNTKVQRRSLCRTY